MAVELNLPPSPPSPENAALDRRRHRLRKQSPPTTCRLPFPLPKPTYTSTTNQLTLHHSFPSHTISQPSMPIPMLATSPLPPPLDALLFGCLMAVSMDFKYFCKICKKGFGCGRALGGHMRAHGIAGEDGGNGDDDDNAGDWEDKNGLSSPAAAAADRRMYTLRANPNRLRSCRACENCGEEFSSWKSFLEHGRCGYDEEDDGGGDDDDDEDDVFVSPAEEVEVGRWSKGKRSRRLFRPPGSSSSNAAGGNYSGEEVDLANWLLMLSAARVDQPPAESEESCASASKEDRPGAGAAAAVPRGMFECKGCKKVFSSHQALGGHRASHKKVKGCFAARQDEDVFPGAGSVEDYPTPSGDGAGASASLQISLQRHTTPPVSGKKKSKVHECSICHRVFSSGQALGGHKRCHWVTSNAASEPASMANLHLHQPLTTALPKLDLNMPAPVDELPLLRPREQDNPFRLEVSASLYLQPWMRSHPSSSINFNSDGRKINKESTDLLLLYSENGTKVVMILITTAALGGDFPMAMGFGVDGQPPGLDDGAER